MSFLTPRSDFPVKAGHLALWAAFKVGVWAVVGGLWLLRGHFPWRTAAVGEVLAYAPIPIYFAWVAWMLFTQRRARKQAEAEAKPVQTCPSLGV